MTLWRLIALACVIGAVNGTAAEEPAISYFRDVVPILRGNCQGCHRPGKMKGGLDLTTYGTFAKGGKEDPGFVTGKPAESRVMHEVTGDEPSMPKDAEPLTAVEISVLERWIAQGAKDDTPSQDAGHRLASPPEYRRLPSVTALAWSPDGQMLAVAGFHEVILHRPDGTILGRLSGESPRIESIAFTGDGKLLGAAGGAASEYGEVQLWDPGAQKLVRSIRTTSDSVFGLSFSADGEKAAIGCADKTVRVFTVADGAECMVCNNHLDWVFGTAFSLDGTRLATASRDRAIKLIDIGTGRLIDDVNKPRESLLSLARHPREDLIVSGGENGELRLYKMAPRGGRLSEGDDKENSFVREFGRLSGPAGGVDFSPDGEFLAAGCATGEVRIYKISDGKQVASAKTSAGSVFVVRYHPEGREIAVAGEDGRIHLLDAKTAQQTREFDSVPLNKTLATAAVERP